MSQWRRAVNNLGATWLALLVHAVSGFFLSPFILHRLGTEAFSLWILIFSVTGYYGLLDLGIRPSIVHLTSKLIATGDHEELARCLSTAIAFYSVLAAILLAVTVAGYFYLDRMFTIPSPFISTARAVFVVAGLTVSISLPLTVFAAVLEGVQKFSWLQLTGIAATLLRAGFIVMALSKGRGLLTIVIISLAVSLINYLSFTWMAIQVLPVRVHLDAVEPAALRKMASYGVFAFAILAAEKVRFQSDALVIGVFLSSTAITYFSIGARLVEYTSYAVRGMSQLVLPISAHFHAKSDLVHLRRILIAGSRACALGIFPICLILALNGKSIIQAWVGQPYVSAYPVLLILLIPRAMYLAQSTSVKILLGMGQHRSLAIVLLLEGVANLFLSALLARPLGIAGVALGTAIPLLCTSLLFLPSHVCRLLEVPLGKFLRDSYALALALCAPLVGMLLLFRHQFPAHTALTLSAQSGALAVCYYGMWAAILWIRGGVNAKSWEALLSHALESR